MKINASGEKEIKSHIKTVKKARKDLKKDAGKLKTKIGKDITFALSQDKKVLKDMQKADKKNKGKSKDKEKHD